MAKAPSLPAALEQLYAAEPSAFTALRSRLVKELREAKRNAEASTLAIRHKPTQAAFLLNQLAREHAADVADLVDIGRALARAQRASLRSGGGGGDRRADLRQAMERQRTAMRHLVRLAVELGTTLGVQASTHALSEAFQCALGDPQCAAALEAGQLETVPTTGAAAPAEDNPFALDADEEEAAPRGPKKKAAIAQEPAPKRAVAKRPARVVTAKRSAREAAANERVRARQAARAEKAARANEAAERKARAREKERARVKAAREAAARDRSQQRAAATKARKLVRAKRSLEGLLAKQRALSAAITRAEHAIAVLEQRA